MMMIFFLASNSRKNADIFFEKNERSICCHFHYTVTTKINLVKSLIHSPARNKNSSALFFVFVWLFGRKKFMSILPKKWRNKILVIFECQNIYSVQKEYTVKKNFLFNLNYHPNKNHLFTSHAIAISTA